MGSFEELEQRMSRFRKEHGIPDGEPFKLPDHGAAIVETFSSYNDGIGIVVCWEENGQCRLEAWKPKANVRVKKFIMYRAVGGQRPGIGIGCTNLLAHSSNRSVFWTPDQMAALYKSVMKPGPKGGRAADLDMIQKGIYDHRAWTRTFVGRSS